jgi:hypothetical protein
MGFFEILLIWLLFGFAAGIIGSKKGRGCLGFIAGVIFGPFGLLYAIYSTGNRKSCHFCKELIHEDALICPKCQTNFQDNPPPPPEKLKWYDYIPMALIVGVPLFFFLIGLLHQDK